MISKDLILQNMRWDRREFLEPRKSNLEKFNGSYFLKKGKMFIMASHKKTIVKPYVDKPHEGIVQCCVFQNHRRADRLNNLLHKIFLTQKCIDLESLCIKYNKQVYHNYFEFLVIESDGYPLEGCVELMDYMLRDLEIPTNYSPRCFYFVEVGGCLIRDPIDTEESEKEGSIVVVLRSLNEVIYFEKYGRSCSENTLVSILESCVIN
ncbi:Exosome complex component Rrp42 [Nosema granulosis]|uniref:Ribosomal RNA-processing protein 42 n=1 Tax=Nosema granulosis TaxID=83296 RepID=A0A9P6GZ64_9MICR|nr:Exosome complex component Rrp42 [Nosema granulosis]